MKNFPLRRRILAVLGAALAAPTGACGSEDTAPSPVSIDGGSDTSRDAANDANDANDATVRDAARADDAAADGGGLPTVRRPFLVGARMRHAEATERSDWGEAFERIELDDLRTSRALAEAWRMDGLEEHASIAAFARFTMYAMSVGAPPALVTGAQRAGIEEVAHARACFGLATRYDGDRIGPATLDLTGALATCTFRELVELAVEEGCIGETLGAAVALEQLAGATDSEVRRALTRIARDEAKHAELAWRFAAWCVAEERRGRPDAAGTRDAIRRVAERTIAETRAMEIRPRDVDPTLWRAHGRLTCTEARAAAEEAIVDIVQPAIAELLGDVRTRAVALEA